MEGEKNKMASSDECVLVEEGKEIRTLTINRMANKNRSAAEVENGAEKGETRIKDPKLATNNGGSGAVNSKRKSTLPKQEPWARMLFWCRLIIPIVLTAAAWVSSFRCFGGFAAVSIYHIAYWYIRHVQYNSMKSTNWIRFSVSVIKISGLMIACSGPIVLLEGIVRKPFVFGGAAALFTTCSWTAVLFTLHFLVSMKDCNVASDRSSYQGLNTRRGHQAQA